LHDLVTAAHHDEPVTVCVGGEWYRYPSSFYLPPNARLGFLKSSFGGQLPQPFTEYGSKEKSLTVQMGKFNDMNEEEADRYVDIKTCSYVIELVEKGNMAEAHVPEGLQYIAKDGTKKWHQVAQYEYLNVDRTSFLHRIFYIPILRNGRIAYDSYAIYQRIG
jgi:alpha-1,2-mannosyltransferase